MTQAVSMINYAQGGIRRRATVGVFLLVEAAALLLLLIGTGGMVSTFVLASKRAGVDIPDVGLHPHSCDRDWTGRHLAVDQRLQKVHERGLDHHDQPWHRYVPDLGCQG